MALLVGDLVLKPNCSSANIVFTSVHRAEYAKLSPVPREGS
jgi:hypothetical protein